uniref:Uncharacterized protein n=1 Tax=Acrobeloides nanus TaxID=290746 RepID=A0A914D7M1_9BILA
MDVVKTRLQLQKQTTVYKGMFQAIKYMVRTEGFLALYRGFLISTPQLYAIYINSNVYEKVRDTMNGSPPVISALAGGAATASDQLFSVPMDVLAQYMMIFNNHTAFCGLVKNEISIAENVACDKLKGKIPLGKYSL